MLSDLSAVQTENLAASIELTLAVMNVRSLSNKTFILNNYFTESNLDFLLLTGTWLIPDDLSLFTDLLPQDCGFLNTLRITSRGGGLASIFKKSITSQTIIYRNFLIFELQLLVFNMTNPVACAVIY